MLLAPPLRSSLDPRSPEFDEYAPEIPAGDAPFRIELQCVRTRGKSLVESIHSTEGET